MSDRVYNHPKAAIFVDAENHADLHVQALIARLDRFNVTERHAYADWRNPRLDRLAERLEHTGFEMHHTWSGPRYGAQKNKADGQMARDVSRISARQPEIKAIIIVSGDSFFIPVVQRLQQQGKKVLVAADPLRASKKLLKAADEYLAVGKLERFIKSLDRLEHTNRYLTFRFVVRRSKVESSELSKLIRRGLVIQEEIQRPRRGTTQGIRLNRQAPIVQAALGVVA